MEFVSRKATSYLDKISFPGKQPVEAIGVQILALCEFLLLFLS